MPLDSDKVRLQHMLEAAYEAIAFAKGKSFADLAADRQFQLALIRCIEVIGEAAARVSEASRVEHPHLPWAKMISTRNRLIHAYFDIDLDTVWQTVTCELPELVSQLETVLDDQD